MTKTAFALAVAALFAASSAGALTYTVSASIDGAQETPVVVTPATGILIGTYDDVTNVLTWSGSFTAGAGASPA